MDNLLSTKFYLEKLNIELTSFIILSPYYGNYRDSCHNLYTELFIKKINRLILSVDIPDHYFLKIIIVCLTELVMVPPISAIRSVHKDITAMHLPRFHYLNTPPRIQIDVHPIPMMYSDNMLRQQQIMPTYRITGKLLAR